MTFIYPQDLKAKHDIEFSCTDASECFDENKIYLARIYESVYVPCPTTVVSLIFS